MPFGFFDTQYIDFPPNIDLAYIEGLVTRSGISFPELLREIDSRIVALNSSIDPLVASLMYPTTESFTDDTGATSFDVEAGAEYTLARPQMVEGAAHMLPIRDWEVALGLTEKGLESMTKKRILANVDSMFNGYRNLYRKRALMRFFSDAEVRVETKNPTIMKSPGFAGSGTGDNVFIGPYPDGKPLPGGYTHYYRVASGSEGTAIKTARDRLKKWSKGPYDLVAPQAEIDVISAINPGDAANGFVGAGTALVRGSTTAAEAQVDPDTYLGVLFGDIRVHQAITDFSDANIGLYRTFGNFNPKNPLAYRYDELVGRNAYVKYRAFYPLDQANLMQKFDFGVNNRVAATLISIASSGSYTPPTWS